MSHSNQAVVQLLKAFFEVHKIEVTKGSLQMWIAALADLSEQDIALAIMRFNRECTDYPTPARLRGYSTAVPKDEERAEFCWTEIRRAIGSLGSYESVQLDDPVGTAALREIGGWVSICDTEPDEMKWRKREFVAAYKRIGGSGRGNCDPLPGLHQIESGRSGSTHSVEVKLIATGLRPHVMAQRLKQSSQQQAIRESVAEAGSIPAGLLQGVEES